LSRAELPSPNRRPAPREDDRGDASGHPFSRPFVLARADRASGRRVAAPGRHDLGNDRQGGLGRVAPAEVEPDRAAQPADLLGAQAGLGQPDLAIGLGLPRSHGADVAAAAVGGLDNRRLVELGVVGQDRDRVVWPDIERLEAFVGPGHHEPVDVREALPGRERRPPSTTTTRSRARGRSGRATATSTAPTTTRRA
jgi:hypothetical protein